MRSSRVALEVVEAGGATLDRAKLDSREADLALLSARLGLRVERILAVGDVKAIRGTVPGGREVVVELADAAVSLNPRKVEEACYRDADLAPSLGSREAWRQFAEVIARHAERVAVPTEAEETRTWVARVLRAHDRGDMLQVDQEAPGLLARLYARGNVAMLDAGTPLRDGLGYAVLNAPVWREGDFVVVDLERLAHYLTEHRHLRLPLKALGTRLRLAGFRKRRRSAVTADGRRVRAWTWEIHEAALDDEGGPEAEEEGR